MMMARLSGLFMLVPTTVLLTISFFVLYSLRKIEIQGLKVFGYVVAALLWASALVTFSTGIYTVSTGRHPMKHMMYKGKGACIQDTMKGGRRHPMMQKQKGEPMMKR